MTAARNRIRLKHLTQVRSSNVDKVVDDEQTPVRLCNYVDVYYRDTIDESIDFAAGSATPKEIEKFALRAGDIVITKDSESPSDIAVPAIVDASAEGVVCAYHLAILRPDRAIVDPRFLFWALRSAPVRQAFGVRAQGVTRFGLTIGGIGSVEIPCPPLERQQELASQLDRRLALTERLLDAKRAQAQLLLEREESTFADVVAGRDRRGEKAHSGVEWIGDIPAHWTAPKMVHVARQETGHTPSRKVDEYWVPEECVIPWFSLADVWQIRQAGSIQVTETAERISQLGMDNSAARLLPANTVILSRTASVGFPAILGVPMAVTQDFVGWICGPRVLPRYLYYVLRSMKPVFRSLMIGSTHQTIYMPDIRSFRMPLPPIDEQAEIADRLDRTTGAFRGAAAEIQRSITLLAERREAVITAAVTGDRGDAVTVAHETAVTSAVTATALRASVRTMVAAEIIYRHRTVLRFGRVKLQKLLYLAEVHVGIHEVAGSYRREAAGPFDGTMLDRVEAGLRESALYDGSGGDGAAVSYRPLALAGRHDTDSIGADRLAALRGLVDLVRDLDTRAAEMIATLYAVWNDDLIDGRQVSDDAVVEGVLDDWHTEKRAKFTAPDLHHWLAWMKRVGLTPRGTGPRTIPTMEADLFAGRRA